MTSLQLLNKFETFLFVMWQSGLEKHGIHSVLRVEEGVVPIHLKIKLIIKLLPTQQNFFNTTLQ